MPLQLGTERSGTDWIPGYPKVVDFTKSHTTPSNKAHAVKQSICRHPRCWNHTLPEGVVAGLKPMTYPPQRPRLPGAEPLSWRSVQVATNPGQALPLSQGGRA